MKGARLLILVPVLLALISLPTAAAPLHSAALRDFEAGPCAPGMAYDPACDVNQDGQITIADIQLTAGHWNQTGTWVSDNQHNHLGQTWTGASNSLTINGAFGASSSAPLIVSNTTGSGLRVESVYNAGVSVGTTGGDGINIYHAGSPSSQTASALKNGVEVQGAQGAGFLVGRADASGFAVSSAADQGLYVGSAGQDGVHVYSAGTPSTHYSSVDSNGVEIEGAQGSGLYIGRADGRGVVVNSAGWDGVHVLSAGLDGVFVETAALDGVRVETAGLDGVSVSLAGWDGVYANTSRADGQWGLYTDDAIHGSNVLLHSLSLVAQVTGSDSLTPGDVVAVAGVTDPVSGSTVRTPLVRLADGTFSNVVGVVESRLALTQKPGQPQPAEGATPTETPVSELRSVEGPAQAGDYVAITVMGAAQVKVDDGASIEAGQRLTIAANGRTRPLGTIKVQLAGGEGTADIAENAPVIGVALEAPKDGLVWVLVNPQ